MKIEFRKFNGPYDWGWVQSKVPMKRVEDTHGIMAIDSDKNKTVGAAIFDNVMANSAQLTLIMDTSLLIKHGFLDEIADYAFNNLQLEYLYAIVAENNERSLRICRRWGWVEQMTMPDAYAKGVDMIVFQLHRDDALNWDNVKMRRVA